MKLVQTVLGLIGRMQKRQVTDLRERRNQQRFEDGTLTMLILPDGRRVAAEIVDVTSGGMCLRTREPLTHGIRVGCRVDFARRSATLGMKLLWERGRGEYFEYGSRFVPVVPGTEHLLDNYLQGVLLRAA